MIIRPKIICLIGSTRYMDIFRHVALYEELGGHIALMPSSSLRGNDKVLEGYTETEKLQVRSLVDNFCLRKIDIADEVLVINPDGYIGESTKRHLDYAKSLGKPIKWYEYNVPFWKKYLISFKNRLQQRLKQEKEGKQWKGV